MRVPLLDLKAQYAGIREDVLAAVTEVLDSQVSIGGPKVGELEQRIAALCGTRFAVGVSSGTDALLATLMSLGVGPGDEVITTPFTFFATAGSIARVGATPVFVDIEPDTFNIRADLVEHAIGPRTKAIMPVHLFGQVCDIDEIVAIAARHGLPVIEDAAQSIGASRGGRKAGSFGLAGCFSFFPSKNLGAAGDGGMVVTNDEALFKKVLLARNHGAEPKYYHHFVGGNFRLDAIQAAVLLVKLPHLEAWSEARRRNAAYYNGRFAGTAVKAPVVRADSISVINQYVVRVACRDRVVAAMRAADIGTEIYYPVPLHLQECFQGKVRCAGPLTAAEEAAREVLALPVYPEMTAEMLDHVATELLLLI